MSDPIEAVSSSLRNDIRALAEISQNVANLQTPGFRALRSIPDFAKVAGVGRQVEQSDGALQATGRQLDLALRGPGFFVIDHHGSQRLTRSGAFTLNSEYQLTTMSGDIVLGEDGPITMRGSVFTIDPNGRVESDGKPIAQLQLITVADGSLLNPTGGNTYSYDGELRPWAGRLMQGALEGANVDPAEETVRLIETTRHAESMQKVISIYDQVLENGIKQIGSN